MKPLSIWALFVLAACHGRPPDVPVATVGDETISSGDVAIRDEVLRVEDPTITKSYGLEQLCRAFEIRAVLARHGRIFDAGAIAQEATRIEKETRDPGRLRRIRDLFGNDEEWYGRVFVLPTLIERVAPFEFFRNDPAVQAESRIKAEKFLAAARRDRAHFAKAPKADRRTLEISEARGLRWTSATEKTALSGDEAAGKRWLREVIPRVTVGAIVPDMIDFGDGWLVARYAEHKQGVHYFDAVLFSKGDFSRWLAAQLDAAPQLRCRPKKL